MEGTVRLEVGGGAGPERVLDVAGPSVLVVGRDPACDLRAAADDRRVSRRHCALDVDPPRVRVRDLGSRNGTRVNGGHVLASGSPACELFDGDEVRAGGLTVRVSSPRTRRTAEAAGETGEVGDYLLLRELGRGAQGVVHLARHTGSGEVCALKVLPAEAIARPELVHGFLREFRAIAALDHPRLVRFVDAGATGRVFFLAAEYCEGGSLADRAASGGTPWRVGDAVGIAAQVLDGLAYLHEHLVHRDVKPQNILLAGPPAARVAKLADFGLAKAYERAGLSDYTPTGARGGSVAFMPRSQMIDFKYARPPVDVWAAAACLYWMLTGAPPRDFPGGVDPVNVVLHEPAVPVRERTNSVPARLAALLDGILAEDDPRTGVTPAAREFADTLRETL